MNILVIGGSGTISYGLAQEAVTKGHNVTVINRGNRRNRIVNGAEVINVDINDVDKMRDVLNNRMFDVIIDPLVFDVNGLRKHIQTFRSHCSRYVFISSCCAFGCSDGSAEIDENSPMKPESKYGKGKLACEFYLKENSFDFDYTIIRPYITYGDIRIPIPFACRKNPYTVIERIKNDKPLVCFRFTGEDKTTHNLMDISDFSKVGISVLESALSANNDYNICSRNVYDWKDAYRILYQIIGKEQHVYEVDKRLFKRVDNHLYEDIVYDKGHKGAIYSGEKALDCMKDPLQEISLEEGISRLVDYLETNLKYEAIEEQYNNKTDMLLMFGVKNKNGFLKDYLRSLNMGYKMKLCVMWILLPCKNSYIVAKQLIKKTLRR